MRGWIDGCIATAIADRVIRHPTVTAFPDRCGAFRPLGGVGIDRFLAVRVRNGVVRWEAVGRVASARAAALVAAIRRSAFER
jgi:hypothetical protein